MRGKIISDDVAEIIVRMTVGKLSKKEIAIWTGVSVRSIETVQAFFRRTGHASRRAADMAKKRERRYHMTDEEVGVSTR